MINKFMCCTVLYKTNKEFDVERSYFEIMILWWLGMQTLKVLTFILPHFQYKQIMLW